MSEIPEGVEPGKAWFCAEGKRHFQCYGCEQVFTTADVIDHRVDEDGKACEQGKIVAHLDVDQPADAFSACDDCAERIMAEARKRGLLI